MQKIEFDALYTEYRSKIINYLRRLVGEQEAEDLAQEVFIKAGKALEGFRGESSLSTWLYRIATNTAMDHLRKPSSRQPSDLPAVSADDDSFAGDAVPDSKPVLDSLMIRKDMNECIRGLIDSIPEKYRMVLVLSELEELTNAEIAEVTGLSLDAVKIRLHRARAQLKNEFQTKCHFYRDERNELACDRKTPPLKFLKK